MEEIELSLLQIKKNFHSLTNENIILRKSLESIFNEDEIKSCPSYELMKATYLVLEPSVAQQHKTSTKLELHSIYEPKTSHQIKKHTVSIKPSIVKKEPVIEDTHEIAILPQVINETNVVNVIKVIIEDIFYYFYNNKFYGLDGIFAGKLLNGVIIINDKPFPLQEKKLIHISNNNYRDKDDYVYETCDAYTSHIIGEFNENEINSYK